MIKSYTRLHFEMRGCRCVSVSTDPTFKFLRLELSLRILMIRDFGDFKVYGEYNSDHSMSHRLW